MTPTTGVPEILTRTRDAIAPAMVAAVGRLDPDTRRQASYHLGWTDAEGHPLHAPAGKGIRPALALLSAAAAWSDPSVGIPGAVAVELVHNFSLIHDDIIDGDTERHHRPTVWAVYGVGSAIITGDALEILAHQVLLEASATTGAAASAALAQGASAMIAGQALDVAFEKRRNVTVEECMAMCAAKTGALLACAASIGAVLAGAPPATVGALADFGRQLGLAFQAVDDLLGIWGDPAVTGKPAGNDLRQRKKSMPVVAALAAGGDDADELRELVLGPAPAVPDLLPPLDAEAVSRATLLVERCGGREWTAVRAKAHLDAALGALQRVRLSAVPHRELADLAVFVVERERVSLAERSHDFDLAVANSLGAARDHLLGLQQGEGCWKGELETNVCMDAEDLLLRHFLGILDDEVAAAAGAWIRSQQRDDGTWCTFYGGPGDLSATVEAYVALRLVGDDPAAAHLERAAGWIRAHGGVARTRVFTRIWMAMVGEWNWEDLPVLPPEIMLLPPQVPVNIYDFGCWARQTIVAISIVMAHRPARPLPFSLDELRVDPYGPPPIILPGKPRRAAGHPSRSSALGAGRRSAAGRPLQAQTPAAFELLDRALHHYEHFPEWVLPRTVARRTSLRLAEEWIIRRQEADGCWGGIQPPLVYSLIALQLQGYPLDHPVMKAALDGMEGFVIHDERGRRIEACQSPVWDTALAVVALADAGVGPEDPAMRDATRWLLGEEVTVRGDWAVRRPNLSPGGWAFEFANVNYPDIDDTAEVILALRRAGVRHLGPGDEAIRRGVAWTEGMQSRGGGWGAFDADNDSEVCASLPFSDFGEVTDPPSADVTAHMLEMLAGEATADPAVIRRGTDWLWAQQEPDGSWFGRWGVNYVYGTGAAVPALIAVGVSVDDPRIRRAVAWLEDHQNPDGGWGEDLRSYIDDAWRGRGTSTASQTAWALLALLAAGERRGGAVERGVAWLLETQTEEGTWDEPWFTGTGFPWDFSLNYHLYRLVFPVSALGRYLDLASGPTHDLDHEGSAA